LANFAHLDNQSDSEKKKKRHSKALGKTPWSDQSPSVIPKRLRARVNWHDLSTVNEADKGSPCKHRPSIYALESIPSHDYSSVSLESSDYRERDTTKIWFLRAVANFLEHGNASAGNALF
jgi:hypothetical protein